MVIELFNGLLYHYPGHNVALLALACLLVWRFQSCTLDIVMHAHHNDLLAGHLQAELDDCGHQTQVLVALHEHSGLITIQVSGHTVTNSHPKITVALLALGLPTTLTMSSLAMIRGCVCVAVFGPWLVHTKLIQLKLHGPPCQLAVLLLHVHEPLECGVVSDDVKLATVEVVMEVINPVDDTQAFYSVTL